MFSSTAVANCSAERSFSVLKRLKNYCRSTLSNEKLNALAILAIEQDLVNGLNYDDVIDNFAALKSKRKVMLLKGYKFNQAPTQYICDYICISLCTHNFVYMGV